MYSSTKSQKHTAWTTKKTIPFSLFRRILSFLRSWFQLFILQLRFLCHFFNLPNLYPPRKLTNSSPLKIGDPSNLGDSELGNPSLFRDEQFVLGGWINPTSRGGCSKSSLLEISTAPKPARWARAKRSKNGTSFRGGLFGRSEKREWWKKQSVKKRIIL